jgi:hypothetical protein
MIPIHLPTSRVHCKFSTNGGCYYANTKAIIPITHHGEVKMDKIQDMNIKSLADCAYLLHKTRSIDYRQAMHMMLDTALDIEYGSNELGDTIRSLAQENIIARR